MTCKTKTTKANRATKAADPSHCGAALGAVFFHTACSVLFFSKALFVFQRFACVVPRLLARGSRVFTRLFAREGNRTLPLVSLRREHKRHNAQRDEHDDHDAGIESDLRDEIREDLLRQHVDHAALRAVKEPEIVPEEHLVKKRPEI